MTLLCLPPAGLPPPGPAKGTVRTAALSPGPGEGCLPTHGRVSCFPQPWSLWLKHVSFLALRRSAIPISESSPSPPPPPVSVTHVHPLLQSGLTISGVRVEKGVLAQCQASPFVMQVFTEHLLDAGHCRVPGTLGAQDSKHVLLELVAKGLPPPSTLPTPISLGRFSALCREGTQAASTVGFKPSSATC